MTTARSHGTTCMRAKPVQSQFQSEEVNGCQRNGKIAAPHSNLFLWPTLCLPLPRRDLPLCTHSAVFCYNRSLLHSYSPDFSARSDPLITPFTCSAPKSAWNTIRCYTRCYMTKLLNSERWYFQRQRRCSVFSSSGTTPSLHHWCCKLPMLCSIFCSTPLTALVTDNGGRQQQYI